MILYTRSTKAQVGLVTTLQIVQDVFGQFSFDNKCPAGNFQEVKVE